MTTKSQKAFKSWALLNIVQLFNNCSSCGKERETVKFEDLPESSREGFKELMTLETYKNGATFLYCRRCDEFSILSKPFK